MLVSGKKVAYHHRIKSYIFQNLEIAHQKQKKKKVKILSLIAKLHDSVLLFRAMFRKLKLPFQEVCLSQAECGTGQINENCKFVKL